MCSDRFPLHWTVGIFFHVLDRAELEDRQSVIWGSYRLGHVSHHLRLESNYLHRPTVDRSMVGRGEYLCRVCSFILDHRSDPLLHKRKPGL